MDNRSRAPKNRTITLTLNEVHQYRQRLVALSGQVNVLALENRTIRQDFLEALQFLPRGFVDLVFVDPPYNLSKSFNGLDFTERSLEEYASWLESWFPQVVALLKESGSLYICGDWRSSAAIHSVAQKYLQVRNRITWEREKGRGAARNWKNCSEDIWFCTKSEGTYTFNLEAVKVKRRVIAPYTVGGIPKDWHLTECGNFRLTHPSNLWTDLTVPFWSMPENTDHPTQKPEKLLAKIILASTNPGDLVLDPFLGSGTTSVVAKKLGRRFVGLEVDEEYCCLAEKRLALADSDHTIQGYADGVFWERNTLPDQRRTSKGRNADLVAAPLFGEEGQ